MFTQDHKIWWFAWQGDRVDDWLPVAEELVEKWSAQSQDEIKFESTFHIILASMLLHDNLLPDSARKAFADLTLDIIDEAGEKDLQIDALQISPPARGRKKNQSEIIRRSRDVLDHVEKGKSKTEAYELVGKKYSKSPETIRRDFERLQKERLKLLNRGK